MHFLEDLTSKAIFKTDFKVRDYECDMQARVNNAVYQQYFEHARHEFLNERNLNFKLLVQNGIHLVVTRVEIDYKRSLKSRDDFSITTSFAKISRIKYCFTQSLYKGDVLYAQALVYAAAIDENGKPLKVKSLEIL
jgi:acyl-CoA thioester hydrolase